jgi:hypothetical protein
MCRLSGLGIRTASAILVRTAGCSSIEVDFNSTPRPGGGRGRRRWLRVHPRGLTLEPPDAVRRGRAGEEGRLREKRRQRKAEMQRGGGRGVVYLRRHCSSPA